MTFMVMLGYEFMSIKAELSQYTCFKGLKVCVLRSVMRAQYCSADVFVQSAFKRGFKRHGTARSSRKDPVLGHESLHFWLHCQMESKTEQRIMAQALRKDGSGQARGCNMIN